MFENDPSKTSVTDVLRDLLRRQVKAARNNQNLQLVP